MPSAAAPAEGEHDHRRRGGCRSECRADLKAPAPRAALGERRGGELGRESRVETLGHAGRQGLVGDCGEGARDGRELRGGHLVLVSGVVHVR
jgi:hypothetical protein